jgi:tetratricopeptide (TPR) repeat protein
MVSFSASILKDLLKSLLPGRTASGRLGTPLDYGTALERSARHLLRRQKALDRERAEACALVPELLRRPAERQLLVLRHDHRFQTWGVLERLLERSRDEILVDSLESERLAALALAQTEHLEERYYGPTRIADMRARAAVILGEARRLRSDFAGAEEAFAEARAHLAAGTGDSLERAFLFAAEAALCCCRHCFAPARDLLLQAIEIFVENGEVLRAGGALVGLAAIYRDGGEPARAILLLREAEEIEGARQELARAVGAFGE